MRPLSFRDRFQIVTTLAYLVLGTTIALRAATVGVWGGCVLGAVMLAFGVYRSFLIARALRRMSN